MTNKCALPVLERVATGEEFMKARRVGKWVKIGPLTLCSEHLTLHLLCSVTEMCSNYIIMLNENKHFD